ncbi:MAG: glycosyltransferase family 2 protein [Lachnospiraceae bacterium]|nr:glycosyltransferase family 2 protein [Lachnospiraceae bacterium]
MTFELLVSCVKKDPHELAKTMNISSDAVIVSQLEEESSEEEFTFDGNRIRVFKSRTQGVGINRNTCIELSTADIILFADEDIVYDEGYAEKVMKEFGDHPEADMILFNVRVCEERRTYWNDSYKPVRWYNCGRYPAYSIAVRASRLKGEGIRFSLLFGGGARFSNGEDSLFLKNCLDKGMKIFSSPVVLGEEVPRPSTWFNGYNDKFFYDRGVLYHFLYGRSAWLWGIRWLLKMKKEYEPEYNFSRARKMLFLGIRERGNMRSGKNRRFENGAIKTQDDK